MAKNGYRIFDSDTRQSLHGGARQEPHRVRKVAARRVGPLQDGECTRATELTSGYPHGESHFPASVSMTVEWGISEEQRRKLMWDNAVRLDARAGL